MNNEVNNIDVAYGACFAYDFHLTEFANEEKNTLILKFFAGTSQFWNESFPIFICFHLNNDRLNCADNMTNILIAQNKTKENKIFHNLRFCHNFI